MEVNSILADQQHCLTFIRILFRHVFWKESDFKDKMKFIVNYIVLILLFLQVSSAQKSPGKPGYLKAKIINGDTVFISDIPEIYVFPRYEAKNRWDYWRYRRLIVNVKAAYPYAQLAANKLLELDQKLVGIKSEKKRKELVKQTEKQIRNEFEDEVKHLTITQGRILLKLIDRETGNTTYQVLQGLKGNLSAGFWQTVARIFGSNLKAEYDPSGEDQLIEQVVKMIEAGQI